MEPETESHSVSLGLQVQMAPVVKKKAPEPKLHSKEGCKRHTFHLRLRRSLEEGGRLTPASLFENHMDRGTWLVIIMGQQRWHQSSDLACAKPIDPKVSQSLEPGSPHEQIPICCTADDCRNSTILPSVCRQVLSWSSLPWASCVSCLSPLLVASQPCSGLCVWSMWFRCSCLRELFCLVLSFLPFYLSLFFLASSFPLSSFLLQLFLLICLSSSQL